MKKFLLFALTAVLCVSMALPTFAATTVTRNDSGVTTYSTNLSGSNVKSSTTWKYNIGSSSSTASVYTEIWIDGAYAGISESEKANAYTASISHSEKASKGYYFEGIHYGQTYTPAMCTWGTKTSSYNRYNRALTRAVNQFSDDIVSDFGYNLDGYTAYHPTDESLRDEVVYYFLFEAKRDIGSTMPFIYKDNNNELYLIAYQDGVQQKTIITLDFENNNQKTKRSITEETIEPMVSVETKPGQAVDFLKQIEQEKSLEN